MPRRTRYTCATGRTSRWASSTGPTAWNARYALYQQLDDLTGQGLVRNLEGIAAYYAGDWPAALRLYQEAFDLYTRRLGGRRCPLGPNIGEVLSDQGHYQDAEARLLDALRVARAAGYHFDAANTARLSRAHCRPRRPARRSRPLFRRPAGRHAAAELDADVLRIDAWIAEALLRTARRSMCSRQSTDLLARVDEAGATTEAPLLERLRALALAEIGQIDDARAALDAASRRHGPGAPTTTSRGLDVLLREPRSASRSWTWTW